jgi:hypothetical protein
MNHLYAILSEQQPMLLPILELESDPLRKDLLFVFNGSVCCAGIACFVTWYTWCVVMSW